MSVYQVTKDLAIEILWPSFGRVLAGKFVVSKAGGAYDAQTTGLNRKL
jgi:hypothetical protein